MSDKTILVADDTPTIRNVLTTNLKRKGFNVITASDGASTLRQLRESPPDLVLLDLVLPDIHGFEILDMMRQEEGTKKIPVLIITAHGGSDEVKEAIRRGAQDFVVKPFNLNQLLQKTMKLVFREEDEAAPAPPAAGPN